MSDYLTDEEQLERVRNWWQANGVSLMVGAVLVIAATFGWRWYQSSVAEANEARAQLYAQYAKADEDERQNLISELEAMDDGSAYVVFALLDAAKRSLADGDTDASLARLSKAVSLADAELLADLARMRLAKVQQETDQSDAAMQTLQQIASPGYRSIAQELQGDLHYARGDQAAALAAYQAAIDSMQAGDERPILLMKRASVRDEGSAVADAGAKDAETKDEAGPAAAALVNDEAGSDTQSDSDSTQAELPEAQVAADAPTQPEPSEDSSAQTEAPQ